MNILEWAIMVFWVVVFHRMIYALVYFVTGKGNRSADSVSKTVTKSNTKDW